MICPACAFKIWGIEFNPTPRHLRGCPNNPTQREATMATTPRLSDPLFDSDEAVTTLLPARVKFNGYFIAAFESFAAAAKYAETAPYPLEDLSISWTSKVI